MRGNGVDAERKAGQTRAMNEASNVNTLSRIGTATDIVENRPSTQSVTELGRLRESVEQISMIVGDLEKRLNDVLREEGPSAVNQACNPDEYLVPHADQTRAVRKTAEHIIASLGSILNRLEA